MLKVDGEDNFFKLSLINDPEGLPILIPADDMLIFTSLKHRPGLVNESRDRVLLHLKKYIMMSFIHY